ncbi:uncharacterized protein [Typha angustifolia]|uniref:uncharacterized protein n=1 Tax=Typha angustifolia TaxID=59011 RepID=UPI003C30284C
MASLCCCLGDFNSILNLYEKEGGLLGTSSKMKEFAKHVNDVGLINLGFAAFTWSSRRLGRGLICKRLDRALALALWCTTFLMARVLHPLAVSSDHNPILLRTNSSSFSGRQFHFENWSMSIGSFFPFYSRTWVDSFNREFPISNNLASFSKLLKTWAQNGVRDLRKQLHAVEDELLILQGGNKNIKSQFHKRALRGIHEDLLMKIELYWHQIAHSKHLAWGDWNTSYFHSQATIRKRCKNISSLNLDNGDWIYDDKCIKGAFISHFKAIFKTSKPSSIHSASQVLSLSINTKSTSDQSAAVALSYVCNVDIIHPYTASKGVI